MTIEELREEAAQLKVDLLARCEAFHRKTGCTVTGINVTTINCERFGERPSRLIGEMRVEIDAGI